MPSLSKSQQRVYDGLVAYFHEHGRTPTIRELCRLLGFASLNAPLPHLRALQAQGLILRDPKTARGIRLVGMEPSNGATPPADPAHLPSPRVPTASLLNDRLLLDFGTGCVCLDREEAIKLAGDLLARVRSLRQDEGAPR